MRITQLAPNSVRILIEFEMLCREQEVNPTAHFFLRFYSLKNSGSEKGWFYLGNRQGVPTLVWDTSTSVKRWKNNFVFVPAEDFPRDFWWRPPTASIDPLPGDVKEENFRKLITSSLAINGWFFPEAVLVDGGISRAVINPTSLPSSLLGSSVLVNFFHSYFLLSFISAKL